MIRRYVSAQCDGCKTDSGVLEDKGFAHGQVPKGWMHVSVNPEPHVNLHKILCPGCLDKVNHFSLRVDDDTDDDTNPET